MANVENIVRLPSRKSSKTKVPSTRKAAATIAAKMRRQHVAAGAVAVLAGTLTFLSVRHLAFGYRAVTGCSEWEALISAIGIDVGFLLLEVAQLASAHLAHH
jgi:hypothetical protein